VINQGKLVLVEDKATLMRKLGKRQLSITMQTPLEAVPPALSDLPLEIAEAGHALVYTYDVQREETGIAALLKRLGEHGIEFKDLNTSESSLEDIFVSLVRNGRAEVRA
jgi:ABC-2 type transport system ATP-binding protein